MKFDPVVFMFVQQKEKGGCLHGRSLKETNTNGNLCVLVEMINPTDSNSKLPFVGLVGIITVVERKCGLGASA